MLSNPRGRTCFFFLTFKPHQKKIASKFKLELEKTLCLWDGRGRGRRDIDDSGKGFVGTKFELFLAKLFGLLTFFCL